MTIVKLFIMIIIQIIIISFNCECQALSPFESLQRGYLLKNYPNLFNYDKKHTDSVSYYYEYLLKTLNENDYNYGLGIVLAAEYYYDINDLVKSDSLYRLFLEIKNPVEYKPLKDTIEGYFNPNLISENYYRFVYEDLCEINIKFKNFSKALNYVYQAEKSKFAHFCGNAYMERGPFLVDKKARCYLGLNLRDSALKILLPHIFNIYFNEYGRLIDTTLQLLKEKYKGNTRELVGIAFNNMKTEKEKYKNEFYDLYFIYIDSIKIYIPDPKPLGKSKESDYIKYLWDSDFYKKIIK